MIVANGEKMGRPIRKGLTNEVLSRVYLNQIKRNSSKKKTAEEKLFSAIFERKSIQSNKRFYRIKVRMLTKATLDRLGVTDQKTRQKIQTLMWQMHVRTDQREHIKQPIKGDQYRGDLAIELGNLIGSTVKTVRFMQIFMQELKKLNNFEKKHGF